MTNSYELQFFFIGDNGEQSVREGFFNTLEEVYHRWSNIGSRWFFYPHVRILCDDKVIEEHIDWESL
jgi:hypothetical protein